MYVCINESYDCCIQILWLMSRLGVQRVGDNGQIMLYELLIVVILRCVCVCVKLNCRSIYILPLPHLHPRPHHHHHHLPSFFPTLTRHMLIKLIAVRHRSSGNHCRILSVLIP